MCVVVLSGWARLGLEAAVRVVCFLVSPRVAKCACTDALAATAGNIVYELLADKLDDVETEIDALNDRLGLLNARAHRLEAKIASL